MALDIEQPAELQAYLRGIGRIEPGEIPSVKVLAGGVSNRTVLVERPRGEAWVLKQALPKLRVAVDWFSDPSRVHREALGMRWLACLAPEGAVVPLIFEDKSEHLLAMRAVPQPHANWKQVLLAGQISSDHVRQFGQLLGSIHRRASARAGSLSRIFDDRSFFQDLRLEPYYEYTAGRVVGAAEFLRRLLAETRAVRITLVHGDYSPKNILIHDGRLVLLDHEVIHWGDPAFDVGFALAHLLSKAHHLAAQREAMAGAATMFWEHYRFATSAGLSTADYEARVSRHTLGCLLARVAGRSQLEYLSPEARQRQQRVVVDLIRNAPFSIFELAERFLEQIARHEP